MHVTRKGATLSLRIALCLKAHYTQWAVQQSTCLLKISAFVHMQSNGVVEKQDWETVKA